PCRASAWHCGVAVRAGRLARRFAASGDRNRWRRSPAGDGFARADSIDYLDGATWDTLAAGQSLFLQRRYLGALEQARPDNLEPRYALIFRARRPVAAVVMQIVTVSATRFMETPARAQGHSPRSM